MDASDPKVESAKDARADLRAERFLEFAVAGVAFFGDQRGALPRFHPMLDTFEADESAGPSAVAAWIEEMGVGEFQIALRARASGR